MPVGEAGREALRDRERAAVGVEQVLAEDAHVRVALEQVVERLVQALDHARLLGRSGPGPRRGAPRRAADRRRRGGRAGRARGSPPRSASAASSCAAASRSACLDVGRIERGREPGDRVARPQLGHLLGRALVVALAVRAEPDRADDPEDGRLAAAHRLDERGELLLESGRVGAVEPGSVDPERLGAGEHVAGDADRGRRRLRDRVVLEHDQQAHAPERGEVHRLVERALAERAVADEDDRDPVLAARASSRARRRARPARAGPGCPS